MKRILLILVAVLGLTAASNAQALQFNVGYGGYTQMDATDCHDGGQKVNNAWGALTAGFSLKAMPNLWLGPSYTFSSASAKGNHAKHVDYHAIMFNGRYNYWHNSIVTCYAHLGLGAIISHITPHDGRDSYNKSYFAYQIVPIGAEVGLSRSVALFGELGFGAQGLLQVGFHFTL